MTIPERGSIFSIPPARLSRFVSGERLSSIRLNQVVDAVNANTAKSPAQSQATYGNLSGGGKLTEVKIYHVVAVVGDAGADQELIDFFNDNGAFVACRPMVDVAGNYTPDFSTRVLAVINDGLSASALQGPSGEQLFDASPDEPTFPIATMQRGSTLLWGFGDAFTSAPSAGELCT